MDLGTEAGGKDREYTGAVYEQFALIGKALGSGSRLRILTVLRQAERTVETLARAVDLSVANTSHHLQVLKRSRLVESERRGQQVVYRIADPGVEQMLCAIDDLGQRRIAEIRRLTDEFLNEYEGMEALDADALAERVADADCVVLDVRPSEEYEAGHLACAVSIPLEELEKRLAELPRDKTVVAYCRGPYCWLAMSAVRVLRGHGYQAVRIAQGFHELRQSGLEAT